MTTFDLPPLNALRVFEAAARLGSFKQASEELGITPSAVSHQVANLEATLQMSLFTRRGRRLALNDNGQAYQRGIHDALARLAQATEEVKTQGGGQALAIQAAPSFASKWLMPRIDDFLRDHPDWRVRVEAAPGTQLLSATDVAILYGRPSDSTLEITPLVAERVLALCSPRLLQQGPPLAKPSDLLGHVLIESRNRTEWKSWMRDHGIGDMPMRRVMSVGRSTMAIEAALQGLGVILESDFLAAEELANGSLIAPFGGSEVAPVEDAYFLATRKGAADRRTVSAFAAWISRELEGAR